MPLTSVVKPTGLLSLTITAQLNHQEIKLLVGTGAGTSVINASDIYEEGLPELQQSSLVNVKTVSGEESPVFGKIKTFLASLEGSIPVNYEWFKT